MKTFLERELRSTAVAVALLLGAAGLHAQSPLLVYDFNLDMEPADNVDSVKSLGFRGLVTRVKDAPDLFKLEAYARKVATLDDFELFPYMSYSFNNPASPDLWLQALPILASTGRSGWS